MNQELWEKLKKEKEKPNSIIVSIDKDLNSIPGWHYNFVKETKYFVTEDEAIYNFYYQCLVGDAADNVKGVQGIGPKKAEKILDGLLDEEEMFNAVREAYSNDEEFLLNGECLWMLRTPYPQGRWSFSMYGSQLASEVVLQQELDSDVETQYMESIGEESTDGFPVSGATQVETTDLTEEQQT